MISFIIPNIACNQALEALLAKLEEVEAEHEVIVVQQQLRFVPQKAKVIQLDENVGRAKAWNIGAKEAKGEVLSFLHNDMLLENYALNRMLESLKTAEMVAPRFLTPEGRYGFIWLSSKGMRFKGDTFSVKPEMTLNKAQYTFPILVSREAFEKIGGFDERFQPFGWEDVDFNRRLYEAGFTRKVRLDTLMWHSEGLETKRIGLPWVEIYRLNRNLYIDKWKIRSTGSFIP